MKWLILILSCCSTLAQHPLLTGAGIDWTRASASTFSPTNVPDFRYWFELTPRLGVWGPTSATYPAADGAGVKIWTNYIHGSEQGTSTTDPTYHASGGGGNSTSPEITFTSASNTRFVVGSASDVGSVMTWIFVANCVDTTSTTSTLISDGNLTPWVQFTGGNKLQMNAGTLLAGPATLVAGTWYVITVVLTGTSSSQIYTNGVLYVSGNAGTQTLGSLNIGGQLDTPSYRGNISRVWCWTNTLSAGNLSAAVRQCGVDFGITTP